jgi:hypothetical protein
MPRHPSQRARIKREVDEILATKPERKSTDACEIERARETSERRYAALIANRENVHNSPAWRDAMFERQAIDFMSRAGTSHERRQFGIDRSKHTRVDIRWYVIPNQNKASGGFLPMIEEDGRPRGDTWASRGYAKADAEAMAEERAHEAASRFVGDWNVVVKKGRSARPQ